MTVILWVYGCLGLLLGVVALRQTGARERSGTIGALRDLLAEHLTMGRDRLAAAEARIALLEERLAFHDGFLRISPGPGAERGEPLLATVERVASARARRQAAREDRPSALEARPSAGEDPSVATIPGARSAAIERETTVLRFPHGSS